MVQLQESMQQPCAENPVFCSENRENTGFVILDLSPGPVAARIVPAISGPVIPAVTRAAPGRTWRAAVGRAGRTWRAAPGAAVLLFLYGIVLGKIIKIIWHEVTPLDIRYAV